MSSAGEPGGRPPSTDAERKALASVVRIRILRMCRHEPMTNKQLADRLQMNPATVLHHVRTLVDQDFLAAGDPRRGPRGSREIPYRATGKSWHLDNPPSADQSLLEAFLVDVQVVPPQRRQAMRVGLRLTDADAEELTGRLRALVDEYAARPAGDPWSIFIAMHPDPEAG